MTGEGDRPTREEAAYAAIVAFVKKNAAVIAIFGPIVALMLLPVGPVGVVLVPIVWLVEAIAYARVQRRRGVRPADPATALTTTVRWAWRLVVVGTVAVAFVVLNRLVALMGG